MTTLFKDVNEHNILDYLLSKATHTIQISMKRSISEVGLFPFVRSLMFWSFILLCVSNGTMNHRNSRIIVS